MPLHKDSIGTGPKESGKQTSCRAERSTRLLYVAYNRVPTLKAEGGVLGTGAQAPPQLKADLTGTI